jgi:hypothetical protein
METALCPGPPKIVLINTMKNRRVQQGIRPLFSLSITHCSNVTTMNGRDAAGRQVSLLNDNHDSKHVRGRVSRSPLDRRVDSASRLSSFQHHFRVTKVPELGRQYENNCYPCPLSDQIHCKALLSTSSHAKRHARSHKGEKNQMCPECGRAFTRRDNMESHRKVHRERLPGHTSPNFALGAVR